MNDLAVLVITVVERVDFGLETFNVFLELVNIKLVEVIVNQFTEFVLNKSDFCPAGLEGFQSLDVIIVIAGQFEIAYFFNQFSFQFKILFLIGRDVFELR